MLSYAKIGKRYGLPLAFGLLARTGWVLQAWGLALYDGVSDEEMAQVLPFFFWGAGLGYWAWAWILPNSLFASAPFLSTRRECVAVILVLGLGLVGGLLNALFMQVSIFSTAVLVVVNIVIFALLKHWLLRGDATRRLEMIRALVFFWFMLIIPFRDALLSTPL